MRTTLLIRPSYAAGLIRTIAAAREKSRLYDDGPPFAPFERVCMASVTPQKILNLRPGEFLRSAAGFFCRLPDGRVAFIPSVFRLPWQPGDARIVGPEDIVRLLRAELVELLIGIGLMLVGIHYFFADILDFYADMLSLPLAIVAHMVTTFAGIIAVLALNNVSLSFLRIRMTRALPKAPGDFTANAMDRWSRRQRIWLLSFLSGEKAANLNKLAVLLYMMMFVCSGPLLIVVLILLATSGRAHTLDGTLGTILAFYIVISLWAFVESATVLYRRMQAGRKRREAKQAMAQGS